MFSSYVGKIWGKFSPKIEIFVIFRENLGEFSVIYGEKYFRHIWLCTCALRHIWGKIPLTFLSVYSATGQWLVFTVQLDCRYKIASQWSVCTVKPVCYYSASSHWSVIILQLGCQDFFILRFTFKLFLRLVTFICHFCINGLTFPLKWYCQDIFCVWFFASSHYSWS
jgi:hypothetical protein